MSETTTEERVQADEVMGDARETVARAADQWARMEDAWATSVAAGENCRPADVVAARSRAAELRAVAAAIRALPDLNALVADLAALPTTREPGVGRWAELDALILRARTLMGDRRLAGALHPGAAAHRGAARRGAGSGATKVAQVRDRAAARTQPPPVEQSLSPPPFNPSSNP